MRDFRLRLIFSFLFVFAFDSSVVYGMFSKNKKIGEYPGDDPMFEVLGFMVDENPGKVFRDFSLVSRGLKKKLIIICRGLRTKSLKTFLGKLCG